MGIVAGVKNRVLAELPEIKVIKVEQERVQKVQISVGRFAVSFSMREKPLKPADEPKVGVREYLSYARDEVFGVVKHGAVLAAFGTATAYSLIQNAPGYVPGQTDWALVGSITGTVTLGAGLMVVNYMLGMKERYAQVKQVKKFELQSPGLR